jgi:Na+/H+-dicarboxylate symporter
MATDRILDMMRTTVNVFGDTTAAVVIAASEGEKIYPRVAA